MDRQRCFDCGAFWHPHMRRDDHRPDCIRRRPCPGCGLYPTVKTGEQRHYEGCEYIRTTNERTGTPEQIRATTDTCEHCDEPRHLGSHCADPFKCYCDTQLCEDARRRLMAYAGVPFVGPKNEEDI